MEKTPLVDSPEEIALYMHTLKMLYEAPLKVSIGSSAAFLVHCLYNNHRTELRRVLNEPVIREGFVGTTLIKELMRASR